jgi:hypothetical protein
MACSLFIDDQGEVCTETELRSRLPTHRSGVRLSDVLVRQLGYIRLAPQGRTTLVELSRRVVSQKALAGLLYWSHDHTRQPLVLQFSDAANLPQLVTRPAQLGKLVGSIIDAQTARPRYVEQPIALEKSAFSYRWPAARDVVLEYGRTERATHRLDTLFGGHWTLSTYDPERTTFRFSDIGSWYFNFDPLLAGTLVGKATTAFRDRAYGRQVQRSFDGLATVTEPRAQLVDAVIKWGEKPARNYTYSRLLMPLAAPGGGLLALSATIIH